MKSLFNRLAGVAVVGVVLYSCASIGRPEGGAIDETPPRFVGSTPAPGELFYYWFYIMCSFFC